MQQVVEGLEEFRAAVGGPQRRHRLAVQRQAVLVVVFVGAPLHRQPVLLVLDVAPEQVVERPQRVDLEMRQRIAIARRRARSGSAG